ncbi:MAG: 2'-5' RNA ligase family protein [Solirubrobacteraceae bacterium]
MPEGHGARLFFAVEVPGDVRRELAAWARRSARGARMLDPKSLHLTLLFLGSRPFDQIDRLAAALARVAAGEQASVCELSLGAPVWLPPRRPRALAVEVHDPSGALAQLQAALVYRSFLEPAGARYERLESVELTAAP